MSSWSSMKSRITASVRTSNRMNLLLSENMLGKRKALQKLAQAAEAESAAADAEKSDPKNELQFFRLNFNMEKVYKVIESTIEERLLWDRTSRQYDSWRATSMAESLAAEIRDGVKKLNNKRHRIVCILSIIEKQNQGISLRMRHLMDEKTDNFANFVFERPTYTQRKNSFGGLLPQTFFVCSCSKCFL